MKNPLRKLWQTTVFLLGGAATLALLSQLPFNTWMHAGEMPRLKEDTTPIVREGVNAASFAPVVKRVAPSVVNIYTTKTIRQNAPVPLLMDPFFRQFFGGPFQNIPKERRERALGSGVIVSSDGYILTNNHVVENADEIKVSLADDKTIYDAEVIGTDPQTDIAVIKIDAKNLPAITLADSDQVEVGDVVLAIGNPFGVGQTVTSGIVSAKGRGGMGIVDYEDFIQTDASINPGNSGGALVDVKGRLVGINTAILSRTGGNNGVGFAVPVNLARYIMERLITDGEVTRGYLGVYIQAVTPELAKEFDLKEDTGALVSQVTPDSPADEAGFKEGDVIVEMDGKPVKDSRHLRLMVAQTRPGTKVTFKIIRDGKSRTLTAKLDKLDEAGLAKAGERGLRRWSGKSDLLDGVEVADLTTRLRQQFDIPRNLREGALVVNVEPGSAAAAAGLRPGDVILSINRRPVADADEAIRLSNEAKGNRMLLRVWSQGGVHYLVITERKRR